MRPRSRAGSGPITGARKTAPKRTRTSSSMPLPRRGGSGRSSRRRTAEAGTDTSRIATYAERDGDRWMVNGTKAWLSNGQHSQKALILARTTLRDPDRPLRGLTLFFVDLDPAACALEVIDKLGRNAVD